MREIFPFSTRNTSIPNKKYPSPHAPNGTNLRCPFMVAYRWGWRGQEKVKAELNNFYWSFESCHIGDWMHIEMTSNNHLFSKIQNINDKLYQIQYGTENRVPLGGRLFQISTLTQVDYKCHFCTGNSNPQVFLYSDGSHLVTFIQFWPSTRKQTWALGPLVPSVLNHIVDT